MKTREERTTRSKHFDWVEAVGGDLWFVKRNAQTLFTVRRDDWTDEFKLVETTLHNAGVGLGPQIRRLSLDAMKDVIDKRFEDWAHALGLKIGPEWWKEDRDG